MKTKTTHPGSMPEIDSTVYAQPEFFRFMVDRMIDGAVILDRDGKITYANRSICRLSEFSTKELTGNKYLVLIDYAEHSLLKNIFSDSGFKKIDQLKTILRSKTGKEIHVVLSWNPYVNNDSEIEGHCLFIKDITQEKKLDYAYKESKENYRLLIENHGEGMGIIDRDENFVLANPVGEQIFGVAPGGLVNRNLKDFVVPDQFQKILEETQKRIRLEKSTYEIDIITPAGELRTLQLTATPQINGEGNYIGSFGVFRNVTKHKKIEQRLIESEKKYRLLIENQGEGIGIVDKDENFVFANPAGEQIFGVPPGTLVSRNLVEFVVPEKMSQVIEETEYRSQLKRSTYETEIVIPSGHQKTLLVTATPQVDKEGKQTGTFGIFRDITELKKIQETLRQGELKYRTLFESAQDAIFMLQENRFVDCNSSVLRMFGCEKHEIIGQTPDAFSPVKQPDGQDSFEKSREKLKLALEGDSPPFEWRHKQLKGTEFDAEVILTQIEVDSKPMILAFVRDITERKRTEEALRQGELRYHTLFDSARDAIFLIHEERFVDCNPATLQMFGCDKHEIINKSPDIFCPTIQPDGQTSYEKIHEKINLAFAGDSHPFEFKHNQLKGAEFDAEIIITPIEVDSKPMILAFVRDITERKRTEEALLQSEQKYRDTATLLPTVIYEVDLNGNLTYANQIGTEWFGFTEEEIEKGINVFQFIAPQHRQRAAENFVEIVQHNKISSGEYLAQKKNGEIFDVYMTSRAISKDGKVVGIRGNIIDITERKKAEETALKLALIVESSNDAIIGKTLDGIISSWNKGAEIIFGYTAHEIIGKPALILITDDHREEEKLLLEKIRNGEHISHYETIRRKKDGSEFEVSLTISPIRNLMGDIIGAASIVRDITERRIAEKFRLAKEAAEALLKSEEKFSKAFHNSPVPICITTLNNPKIIEVNKSFEEQTGFTKEEMKDRSLLELSFFHDLQDLKMIIHDLTTRGYVRNKELTLHIKNGDKRICLLSSEVFELGGEPCALTVLLDITERRLAEQTINESKQRFELMVEQSLVGFIECDTNFMITSWNPSAERIFGYTAKEAIGRHVGNLIVKEEEQEERNKLWKDILASEAGISITNTNKTKDGRIITCEWHDTTIMDSKGQVIGIVSLVADISGRIEIEESLRNSREQLQQFAQHLQVVREEERVHISRELHDSLGQSLTGLKMYAFNIHNKLKSELSEKNLDHVRNQSKEVLEIIDGIMQQVRKIAKDLRPRILDEFGLIPAIESHIQEITKQTGIKYEVIKMIQTIEMDPMHSIEVFRIFQETCTNIIRHANATMIIVRINSKKNSYILEVEDNGCGIKETDIAKLQSLGLLGMKERSQVFDGNLEINGVEGKGTKVVLTFPKKTNKS